MIFVRTAGVASYWLNGNVGGAGGGSALGAPNRRSSDDDQAGAFVAACLWLFLLTIARSHVHR
jgi:hypothetical protein